VSKFHDNIFDDNECRFCCEMTNRQYFCSDEHAIKFAEAYAEAGYTFKNGKPVVNWTYIKPKEK